MSLKYNPLLSSFLDDTGSGSSITTPISVLNGGWGQDMTMQTSTLTGGQAAFPSGLIKWAGATPVTIQGIVAPTTSNIIIIQNATAAQNITIAHQNSGATAINRIITQNGGTITVFPGFSAKFYYDTVTARWRVIDIAFIIGVSQPLAVTSGNLAIPPATTSVGGYLTSTDWNTFNSKLSGNANEGSVPYYINSTNPGTLYANGVFGYDSTLARFGVGPTNGTQEATGHFKSDTAETLAVLTSPSVTLTQFVLPVAQTFTVTATTPDISKIEDSGSVATNLGSGAYTAGDVVDYVVTPGYDDGMGTITWGVGLASIGGITDASNFDVSVSWATTTGQNFTPNVWSISRQVNSGGYNDYTRTTSIPFNDTNSGWTGGNDTFSVFADDFLETSHDYTGELLGYEFKASPIATTIISGTPYDPAFTDAGTGNTFKMLITNLGAGSDFRFAWPGTRNYDINLNPFATFISGPIGPTSSGAPTVTPSTYGYLSDGSALNRDYDFYNFNGTIYSVSSGVVSTVDPNNGLYYYNIITYGGVSTTAKVLRQINGGGYDDSEVDADGFNDDGVTAFAGNVTVTPNSTYPMTGLFESHGSALTDLATVALRSLDGSYVRLDFLDNVSSRLGYLYTSSTDFTIQGQGTGGLTMTSTSSSLTAANAVSLDSQVGHLYANGSDRFGWSSGGAAMYCASGGTLGLVYNGAYYVQVDSSGIGLKAAITLSDLVNISVGTSNGTKIGTSTSQKLGFWNTTPVVQSTGWTTSNVTTDKVLDANATSLDEVADVLCTLIEQLKTYGLLGA